MDTSETNELARQDRASLLDHRFDRGRFMVLDDVEIQTSPNGVPGRLVKLRRGQVLHLITHDRGKSADEGNEMMTGKGMFVRDGADPFYIPDNEAAQVLVQGV